MTNEVKDSAKRKAERAEERKAFAEDFKANLTSVTIGFLSFIWFLLKKLGVIVAFAAFGYGAYLAYDFLSTRFSPWVGVVAVVVLAIFAVIVIVAFVMTLGDAEYRRLKKLHSEEKEEAVCETNS